MGDHIWYISDTDKFKNHFPEPDLSYVIDTTPEEMVDVIALRV